MNPAHFTLEEFLVSDTADSIGVNNYPSWEIVDNLTRLADTMERIRAGLGGLPVHITSGYRSPEVNAVVGGATNSAHLYGLACDFVVPAYCDGDTLAVCKAIEPYMAVLDIDQLIWEMGWIHLGLVNGTPRYQCLTIDDSGTCEGFP